MALRAPLHLKTCELSFNSQSPAQSKRAVVKTLMDWAKCLLSSTKQQRNVEQHVISDLEANGYPVKFTEKTCVEKGNRNKIRSPRKYNGFCLNPVH